MDDLVGVNFLYFHQQSLLSCSLCHPAILSLYFCPFLFCLCALPFLVPVGSLPPRQLLEITKCHSVASVETVGGKETWGVDRGLGTGGLLPFCFPVSNGLEESTSPLLAQCAGLLPYCFLALQACSAPKVHPCHSVVVHLILPWLTTQFIMLPAHINHLFLWVW